MNWNLKRTVKLRSGVNRVYKRLVKRDNPGVLGCSEITPADHGQPRPVGLAPDPKSQSIVVALGFGQSKHTWPLTVPDQKGGRGLRVPELLAEGTVRGWPVTSDHTPTHHSRFKLCHSIPRPMIGRTEHGKDC